MKLTLNAEMIKKLTLLFFFLSFMNTTAQKDKFWIQGKVTDSSGVVKNANILDLKTNKGTFTTDLGDYKMIVSIGDTIKFTSVQHQTVYRVINEFIYGSEVLDVYMVGKTVVLDEVVVKRHDLDGYLSLDRKRTPTDRKAEALKRTMDFSNEDMSIRYDGDHIDMKVRPPVTVVDPTMWFVGAGAALVMPFKQSERLWALRRDVDYRKTFPQMLLSEFGEPFFENELKIPKIRYYHFLEYCNPLGIEKLYQQNRKIELINILREESKKYLKLLEEEELE